MNVNIADQQHKIEGIVMKLTKELEKLAPEPACPEHKPLLDIKLDQKAIITGRFNSSAMWNDMMKAYLRDLPRRKGIERWLNEHRRKLYALHKQAHLNSFRLAA